MFTAPTGRTVTVSKYEVDSGEGLGLEVRVGDRCAVAECVCDGTTWVGGRDGMHMEPPYRLVFTGPDGRDSGGGWTLSAWTIAESLHE